MSRLAANVLLLLAGAVWGMGFVAQSTAMAHVGPWTFTAARFFLATLTVLPFVLVETRRAGGSPGSRVLAGFGFVGLMLFVASIVQQVGILSTTVTSAGFLTGLYVPLTPILALLILKARPHWVVWPGAALAFLGIVLLGGGRLSALGTGECLLIAGAAFFALQILLVGRYAQANGRPLTLSCVQFAATAALSAIGAFAFEAPAWADLAGAWREIVYGGVFSAGLAFTLQTIGQRYTTASQAAIFLCSEALFAALFGALFLGERITPLGYLGCTLIFVAMLAVELVPLSGRRPKSALV